MSSTDYTGRLDQFDTLLTKLSHASSLIDMISRQGENDSSQTLAAEAVKALVDEARDIAAKISKQPGSQHLTSVSNRS